MRNDRAALIRAIMDAGCDLEVAEAAAAMLWNRRIPSPTRRRGRPPWIPTPAERDRIIKLRASGVPVKVIAVIYGIDETTLRKRCQHELAHATELVRAALGGVMISAGLSGDWRASLAWLSRHGGEAWQKPPSVHLVGGAGTPIAVDHRVQVYLPDNHRPRVTISTEPAAIADSELEDDPIPLG